jgi:hypothetical protein
MKNVEMRIDRLVLRGVDAANRNALVSGLKSELERVLADPVVRAELSSSRRTPVLRLGAMHMESGVGGARRLGGSIARGIGKAMQR